MVGESEKRLKLIDDMVEDGNGRLLRVEPSKGNIEDVQYQVKSKNEKV